jgi:pectin methylesterase-like acyl-CoA thioesterase
MRQRSINGALVPYEGREVLRVGPFQFPTVQAAVDAASPGATILIPPGEYDENVVIATTDLTLIGDGPQGTVRITGLAPNGTGIVVNGVNEVGLVNINASGRGTGAGLKLTGTVKRFRAELSRFAGGADGVLIAAAGGQVVDVRFDDCRLEGVNGVHFTAGGGDPTSQVYFKACDFQYCSGRWAFLDGIHVTGLFVQDCNFLPNEDGSAPATKGITANFTGTTGMISGCKLALAAHASASIELADAVLYVGNFTEAGISSARPA